MKERYHTQTINNHPVSFSKLPEWYTVPDTTAHNPNMGCVLWCVFQIKI